MDGMEFRAILNLKQLCLAVDIDGMQIRQIVNNDALCSSIHTVDSERFNDRMTGYTKMAER
jgi:hypothetical protein